jgi:hypothetical protein
VYNNIKSAKIGGNCSAKQESSSIKQNHTKGG